MALGRDAEGGDAADELIDHPCASLAEPEHASHTWPGLAGPEVNSAVTSHTMTA
jgi:hypothetical protein